MKSESQSAQEPASQSSVAAVEAEGRLLAEAERSGLGRRLAIYTRLSGPGWLQSALTLGGGSMGSSLYLGVLAGYSMLWVQPVAMILGIVMLSAIGYVALSTRQRPFAAINEHVNPVLGWGWALASLAANMVWCMPQYSLLTGVVQQNLLPNTLGADSAMGDQGAKLAIVTAVLVITTLITWAYDSGSWGVRLYEWMLKLIVAMIVLCFIGVVFQLARTGDGLPWGEIAAGFIPDVSRIFRPSPAYAELVAALPEKWQQFWTARIVDQQRDVLISAAATAVGINMTFLLPYSLLARGWDKRFRGMARFDLATGMLIPYMLATSCVIIAAGSRFQPTPTSSDVVDAAAIERLSDKAIAELAEARLAYTVGADQFAAMTPEEVAAQIEPLGPAELTLAGNLVRRDAFDLARSLQPLTGEFFANIIFGVGVLGMTLSTITLLMLNSGFVICEMLGIPPKGWPHRFGTLAAAIGALGPFVWGGERAAFYLVVPTSVFGMILLPVAYWTFFLMMNQRSLLGDEMPQGGRRLAWNGLMALAAAIATVASVSSVWAKAGTYGILAIVAFVALVLAVGAIRKLSLPAPTSTANNP